MKNLFFLFLIFFSYQVVGNEIICTNEINITHPPTDKQIVIEIGFPNLDKSLSLTNKSTKGEIWNNNFGHAFREKILIDQNKNTFSLYSKLFTSSKWSKSYKRKFQIITNDYTSFFVEIIDEERKYDKEFFEIIKSTNHYTRIVLNTGYRQITIGECTN